MAPAVRDAQLNTRASVRTLAESASPISISARLFVGLAVLARLAIKSVRAGRRINCSVYRLSSLSSGSGRALAQPTGRRPEHRRLQRWPSSSRAEAKPHTGHHIVVCARRLRRTLCSYSWSSHPHREHPGNPEKKEIQVFLSETHARIYWWCSPPKIGTANV
jgi:hypothetical protein